MNNKKPSTSLSLSAVNGITHKKKTKKQHTHFCMHLIRIWKSPVILSMFASARMCRLCIYTFVACLLYICARVVCLCGVCMYVGHYHNNNKMEYFKHDCFN